MTAEGSRERIKKAVSFLQLTACFLWWAHQDLNLGPKDYESSALTN